MNPQQSAIPIGAGSPDRHDGVTCWVVRVNGRVHEGLHGSIRGRPVVALLHSPTPHTVRVLLEQGIAALVDASRELPPHRINWVIAQVHAHGVYVDPSLQRMTLGHWAGRQRDCSLSPRQHEVLWLYADLRERSQIAHALGIKPVTVDDYYQAIRGRLGVRSMTEAVALARAGGWL